MTTFKERIHLDLKDYLTGLDLVDKRLPECPDFDACRNQLLEAFLPDDKDWSRYAAEPQLYEQVRDVRGYDCMDEYIMEEVLHLDATLTDRVNRVVNECAARTLSNLRHADVEPGTPEAFHAYVDCLSELYTNGAAIHQKHIGYHMTLID